MSRVVTALVATLVTLLCIEIALRVIGFDPLADIRSGRGAMLRVSANPDLQYDLTPGASGLAWETQVSVNSAGFRGPEVSLQKRQYRIEVLGDSIAFGSSLPAGTEFPAQLGRLLEGRAEVLNMAVSGYDTLQEDALFETKGRGYDPDLVVVTYCLNDTGVANTNLYYVKLLQWYGTTRLTALRTFQFLMVRIDRIMMGQYLRWANRPAVFRRIYRDRIDPIGADERDLRSLMREAGAVGHFPSDWYATDDRVGRLRYAFRRLRSLVGAGGHTRVLVLIVPWLAQHGDAYPHTAAHRIVAHEAERVGFDVLDLTAPFMARGIVGLRVSQNDPCHPNPEGHHIMAEAVARYVTALRAGTSDGTDRGAQDTDGLRVPQRSPDVPVHG